MKFILSRYNHDIEWVKEYTDDVVIYDRSKLPLEGSIIVPNIGSDIYDKLTYIIDHYDNLPDVAIYSKANIFKYITKHEFDKIKDNTVFTPILTQGHTEVMCDEGMINHRGKPFSFYKDSMYYELNYPSYLRSHNLKNVKWDEITHVLFEEELLEIYRNLELVKLLGLDTLEYIPFAPGSNYILPKENILKHPKEFYEKLRSYLDWDRYPGEAFIVERALYTLWK